MADVAKAIIDIEINSGTSAQVLKSLQAQVNAFNMSLNSGARDQAQFAASFAKSMQYAINQTGAFTAEAVKLSTAAATLDKNLSKGKASLGQFFSAKFSKNSAIAAETMALAAERAKRMQTQFIATSAAAKGFQNTLAVRPLTELSSQIAIASERTQLLSTMFKQGTTQLINFGKNVQWAGRQLMVGFTVPLTIFGNLASKTFSELEQSAIRFKRVYGDIFTTEAETARALEGVTNLAKSYTKYNIAVKDTINLAADLAAAGYQGTKLNEAIIQTNRLATLGNIDQQKSMSTIISLQNAFQISSNDLAGTINYLNSVENQTVVSLEDITEAIPRVAPVIKGLGGDVRDLTVFLAAMEEGGVSAEQGANALKSGLASLINPTKAATQTLAGFGINLNQIVETNKGDLMGTVTAFGQALSTLSDFQKQQAIESVFGKYQFARLGALFTNIVKEGGQANKVLQLANQSAIELAFTANKELGAVENAVSNKFKAAIEDLKVSIAPIGELFLKVSIPVLNFLEKIVNKFNELSDGKKQFIAIATIITGVVIPAGTMFFGLLMNLVGTLLKLSQGFGSFAKGFVTGGPIGAIKALTQSSKYLSLSEIDAAMAAQQLAVASESVNEAFMQQVNAAGAAKGAVDGLTRSYLDLIATQGQASRLPGFTTAGVAASKAKAKAKGFAYGGVVSGPGGPKDDAVPVNLSDGEVVISVETAKKNPGIVSALLAGQKIKIPGFATSGRARGTSNGELRQREIIGGYDLGHYSTPIQMSGQELLDMAETQSASFKESINKIIDSVSDGLTHMFDVFTNQVNVQSRVLNQKIKQEESGKVAPINLFRKESVGQASVYNAPLLSEMEKAGASQRELKLVTGKLAREFEIGIRNLGNITEVTAEQINEITQKAYEKVSKTNKYMQDALTIMEKPSVIKEVQGATGGRVPTKGAYSTGAYRKRVNDFIQEKIPGLYPTQQAFRFTGKAARSAGVKDANSMVEIYDQLDRNAKRRVQKMLGDIQEMSKQVLVEAEKAGISTAQHLITGVKSASDEVKLAGENLASDFVVRDKRASKQVGALSGNPETSTSNATVTSATQLIAKEEEVKQSKRASLITAGFANKAFAASMAANALGGAMMMAGGSVGEMGQKIFGFSSAITGISAILPMLGSPIGALTLTVGAAVAAYKIHNDAVKQASANIRKAALEQANAMTGSAKTVSEFAKATGAENLQAKRSQRNLTTEQSSAYYQALTSGDMAETMATYQKALKNDNLANVVAGDIGVLSSAFSMTSKDIQGYIEAVSTAMEDRSLGVKVRAELIEMIYDDGKTKEDLLKNPSIPIDFQAELKKKGKTGVADFLIKNAAKDIANNKFNNALMDQRNLFAQSQAMANGMNIKNLTGSTQMTASQAAIATQYTKDMDKKSGLSKKVSLAAEGLSSLFSDQAALNLAMQSQKNNAGSLSAAILAPAGVGLAAGGAAGSLFGGVGAAPGAAIGAAIGGVSGAISYGLGQLGPSEEDVKALANNYQLMMNKSAEASNILVKAAEQNQMAQESLNMAYEDGTISLEEYRSKSAEVSTNTMLLNDSLQQQIDLLKEQGGDALKEFAKMSNEAFDIKIDASSLPDEIKKRMKETFDEFENDPEMQLKYQMAFAESGMSAEQFLIMMNSLKAAFPEDGQLRLDVMMSATEQGISLDKIDKYARLINALPTEVRSKFILDGQITPEAAMAFALQSVSTGNANYKEGRVSQDQIIARANQYLNSLKYVPGTGGYGINGKTDGDGSGSGGSGKGGEDWLKYLANRFDLTDKRLAAEVQKYQDIIDLQQRQNELDKRGIEVNNRALDQLSKQEEALNKNYDNRIKALDDVAKANDRVRQSEQSRIGLATALASGDIAGAASQMAEIVSTNAANQIEDTRYALESQRESALKNLRVNVNGELLTREEIQSRIDTVEEAIYQRELKIRDSQDAIYNIEKDRLANSREREKIETKLYLLEQRKAILNLDSKKINKKLTVEEKGWLADYRAAFNQSAAQYNSQYGENIPGAMYGGAIKKFAFGNIVPGMGNTDRVPALLTPGEFVVRKSAAKAYMPLLQGINSGLFPEIGKQNFSQNNYAAGIGSPRYTFPDKISNISPEISSSNAELNTTMYNDTYNISVNVAGTNASPDDIANVVMAKLSRTNNGNIRGIRY